jgi:hypothetical protein
VRFVRRSEQRIPAVVHAIHSPDEHETIPITFTEANLRPDE